MGKQIIKKIRTTGGNVYILGRLDGKIFVPNRFSRQYRRKSSAMRALKK